MFEKESKIVPHFTHPVRQIMMMLVFVVLVVTGGFLSYLTLLPIIMANVFLSSIIGVVFIFGVITCFGQVFTLFVSVNWIEGFAANRPGIEFVQPPGLLAPLAHLLGKRDARTSLTSNSTRSIQDSVATRLDEGREISRYVINLLIYLGLWGTFYGLAITVPAVVDTIRSLAPQADGNSLDVFDKLISGLERQLSGMGTAFGSSLLGLAGSLIVGLLDLITGRGQNRFYREMEEWLSSITSISVTSGEGEPGENESSVVSGLMETSSDQFKSLQTVLRQGQEISVQTEQRLAQVAQMLEQLAQEAGQAQNASVDRMGEQIAIGQAQSASVDQLAEQITIGQSQMTEVLQNLTANNGNAEEDELWDAEAKMRLRNIDTQLLRILEEMTAGRQGAVEDLRNALLSLTAIMRQALNSSDNPGGKE